MVFFLRLSFNSVIVTNLLQFLGTFVSSLLKYAFDNLIVWIYYFTLS